MASHNVYAERLRELENALDAATSDWLLDHGLPKCIYCGARMHDRWNPAVEEFKHEVDCPRQVLVNDRIGYRRR